MNDAAEWVRAMEHLYPGKYHLGCTPGGGGVAWFPPETDEPA